MSPEFSANAAVPPMVRWWVFVAILTAALFAAPYCMDDAFQLDISIIFVFALLALSMGFLWGYAGILSFGQTIFFRLGGYSYAILGSRILESTNLPFLGALALPAIFAALLGYFMTLRSD